MTERSVTKRRAVEPVKKKRTQLGASRRPQTPTDVSVSVPSLAKLNLDLRVLYRRADGFHEVRTIYQTISLSDTLHIEFRKAKRTELQLDSNVDIEDNIVLRAARAVLEYLEVNASVRFSLEKKIPMGAGLGGGSSNAASVLIALPALAHRTLKRAELQRLGSWLGSDVPFFLYGGTALGLGRGTELYPLPDLKPQPCVIVPGGVHVSTAEAYRDLQRPLQLSGGENGVTDSLTSDGGFPILGEFQAAAWAIDRRPLSEIALENDFEPVVLAKHPELAELSRRLKKTGADPVRMTGSGSALFGIVPNQEKATQVARAIPGALPVKLVSRQEYRKRWTQALGDAAAYSAFAG